MKKLIGLTGVESTGKSTLAHMLVGRLRTHGVLVDLVAEPGSMLPFSPELFDSRWEAWMYAITNKMATECRAMLRPNINWVISDRTPLDFLAYWEVKVPPLDPDFVELIVEWVKFHYEVIYYLPAEGSVYREDGFRMLEKENKHRDLVDEQIQLLLWSIKDKVIPVEGSTYRLRAEWVYHHILATQLGKTRPLRAYEQVRQWISERGHRVLEVRPQGSNSITRFHPSSDTDDIDCLIVVDGDANYAKQVREALMLDKEQMENMVQADLDLLVVPKGAEPHEV